MIKTREEYINAMLEYYRFFEVDPDIELIDRGLDDIDKGADTGEVFERFLNDIQEKIK